jgi:hypothetical protein
MTFFLKLLLSLWLTTLSSQPSPGPADWCALESAMADQLREAGAPEHAAAMVAQLQVVLAQRFGLASLAPIEACL